VGGKGGGQILSQYFFNRGMVYLVIELYNGKLKSRQKKKTKKMRFMRFFPLFKILLLCKKKLQKPRVSFPPPPPSVISQVTLMIVGESSYVHVSNSEWLP
jgi:hypothetical protein